MLEIKKAANMQTIYELDNLETALSNIRTNGYKMVSTKVQFENKKVIITVKEAA